MEAHVPEETFSSGCNQAGDFSFFFFFYKLFFLLM